LIAGVYAGPRGLHPGAGRGARAGPPGPGRAPGGRRRGARAAVARPRPSRRPASTSDLRLSGQCMQ
jgi:hypothetical protein